MDKKLTIAKNDFVCRIDTEMDGQDLYEALVCLAAYVGVHLNQPGDIAKMLESAGSDAIELMKKKGVIEAAV